MIIWNFNFNWVWRNEDEECDIIETVKSVVDDAACNSGFSGMSVLLKKLTWNNGKWDVH